MKISPSISISYNPTITVSPSDEDDGTSVANKRSSGSSVFTLTLNALASGVFICCEICSAIVEICSSGVLISFEIRAENQILHCKRTSIL